MESKKIVCPNCHGTLEVTNPKQDPLLMIKCPNPACGAKLRIRFDTGETVLAPKKATPKVPGYLTWQGQIFELKEGKNTLGRSSSKHESLIEFPTDDKSMSRVHCLIEVVIIQDGRVKAIFSDIRTSEKIDKLPTKVGNLALAIEDRIVLTDGDLLQIGHQTIRFNQKSIEE
jgi:hypothetical protein